MEPFFIRTFWITLIMLWIALIILYVILTNEKSLRKKGHSEKYINYLRRSHTIRILLIAVLLPILILFSSWIVTLITGPLTTESQLAYIVIVLIVLVAPFKFLDERINQKKIRELAMENKEQVAIDLNYRTLHLIYNPSWELILGTVALLYGLLYLRIEQWIIYLFLLFPWFMYLNIRGTRYQTKPYLTDNYKYMFAFNIFSFLFFLLYFSIYFIQSTQAYVDRVRLSGFGTISGSGITEVLLLLAGFIIFIGLTGRIAIYITSYREFISDLKGDGPIPRKSGLRKWIVFLGLFLTMLIASGLIVFSGGFGFERIEVGIVQEKYMIDQSGPNPDTLIFVNVENAPGNSHGYSSSYGEDLLLGCEIQLSRSGRRVQYEICCSETFRELPVGTIVKYEYGPGPSIRRLIEY